MKVRPAGTADADAIAAVHVQSWQGAYRGQLPGEYLGTLSVERRSQAWRTILAGTDLPRRGALVLEEGEELVGFAHVSPSRDSDASPQTGELTAIYLLPGTWRRGGGRLLLQMAEANLREAGFARATLWVLSSNCRARRFYESLGWQPDGAEKTEDRGSFRLVQIRYGLSL